MARAVRRRKDPREAVLALAPLAVETLAEIMRGAGSDTARIAAAREVLDRAHAKGTGAEAEGGLTIVVRRFSDIGDAETGPAE
jgi:hypothetical protein